MPAKITLTVVQGKLCGQEFVFDERTSCIMGRSSDCDPKVPNDDDHRRISRHHCLLDINPPDIRIRDFGSLNGTFINGQKIGSRQKGQSADEGAKLQFPEHDLKDGDKIQLAETVLRVGIYIPITCSECSQEIPDEQRAQALVAPKVYQCQACKRKAQAVGRKETPKPKAKQCAKCGRNVDAEAGEHRHGQYVCVSCRASPQEILLKLLQLAKSGRKDLGPIKGYTLEKELGRGGMGAVYLARHENSGARVALKVMLPQVAADERSIQLFSREVQNTQALRHSNVVELREAGCSEGTFFFTLEFCDGGDLNGLMKQRGGTLAPDVAVPLILQTLDGLEYAHHAPIPNVRMKDGSYKPGHGLVHRDLKPQNILISTVAGRLVPKVSDFGLGKAFDTAGLSGQTRSGTVMGTPVFMPREQVRRFKYAKPDVDVWAAAATLYHLLTGQFVRDFKANSNRDIWQQILELDAVPIRQRNPRIPGRLAEVIDTALRENPKIGFQTAAEFKRALQGAL